jgi:ribosome-associated protein
VNYNWEMLIADITGILDNEIQLDYIRSPGPGGQNVNKLATSVQLRFDAARSSRLPEEVKSRLLKLAGSRASKEGEIILTARRFRSQEQNRLDAIARLTTLIERAQVKPRLRHPTRPTRSSQEKRLQVKRKRSEIKGTRKKPTLQED